MAKDYNNIPKLRLGITLNIISNKHSYNSITK